MKGPYPVKLVKRQFGTRFKDYSRVIASPARGEAIPRLRAKKANMEIASVASLLRNGTRYSSRTQVVKVLALVWVVLLAACAVQPTPAAPAGMMPVSPAVTPPAQREATATPLPSATPSRLSPAPEEANTGGEKESPVLVYRRSGGGEINAGETWTLYADGRLVNPTGQTTHLSPEQVEQLLQKLEMFGFFELKSRYMPDNLCCDRVTHVIAVRRHGEVKRVTTMDGTPEMPAALQNTLSELWQLFKPGLSKPPLRSPDRQETGR